MNSLVLPRLSADKNLVTLFCGICHVVSLYEQQFDNHTTTVPCSTYDRTASSTCKTAGGCLVAHVKIPERRESRCFAVWGHSGLNILLLVGVAASLVGATLAFVSLDLNDLRFAPDHKGKSLSEQAINTMAFNSVSAHARHCSRLLCLWLVLQQAARRCCPVCTCSA